MKSTQSVTGGEVLGTWDQEAHDWWQEHRHEIEPVITTSETGIPRSMRAKLLKMVYFDPRRWEMKDGDTDWFCPGYFIPPKLFGLAERFRVRFPDVSRSYRDGPDYDDTDIPDDTREIKHVIKLRQQVKRGWRIGIKLSVAGQLWRAGRGRVAIWKSAEKARNAAHRKFMTRDDTETAKVIAARQQRLEFDQAQSCLFSWWAPPLFVGVLPEPHFLNPPCFALRQYRSLSAAVKERYRDHAAAGLHAEKGPYGTDDLFHICNPLLRSDGGNCQCHLDPEPFRNWRPWENPPADHVRQWESWYDGGIPTKLTGRLYRILWDFRGAEPDGEYKPKGVFSFSHEPSDRRRLQLRSWINGKARLHKYARPWECYAWKKTDAKGAKGNVDGDVLYDAEGYVVAGEVEERPAKKPRMIVNIQYTIVTREHRRERKVPGYSLHDSWQDVMAYLGCSRRTAFRKIKEGYRIGTMTTEEQ